MASALYLDRPFFGSRRMAVTLGLGRTRIRRPMRILGIEAHYPKRNLSSDVAQDGRTLFCAAANARHGARSRARPCAAGAPRACPVQKRAA